MYIKSKVVAEELVSDVFFAIWENRKSLHEVQNFNAYIYKIAQYKVMNHLRRNQAEWVGLDEMVLELFARTETTPEDECISKELIERLNQAIEALPAKTKIAFKLIREDGMKYRETAEHLGISIKTLEAHLTKAVKKILKILSID
jgi:RNA polymerase sigma-70 factor (ECF subfamily)